KEQAVGEYKQAIVDDDKFAQAYLSLGNLYLKEGKFQDSKDVFIKAAKTIPGKKDILYGLAFSLEQLGDIPSALAVYQRAVEQESDPEKAADIKNHMVGLQSEQVQKRGKP